MTSKGGTWRVEYGFLRRSGLSKRDAWSREAVIRWALVMRCNLGAAPMLCWFLAGRELLL